MWISWWIWNLQSRQFWKCSFVIWHARHFIRFEIRQCYPFQGLYITGDYIWILAKFFLPVLSSVVTSALEVFLSLSCLKSCNSMWYRNMAVLIFRSAFNPKFHCYTNRWFFLFNLFSQKRFHFWKPPLLHLQVDLTSIDSVLTWPVILSLISLSKTSLPVIYVFWNDIVWWCYSMIGHLTLSG